TVVLPEPMKPARQSTGRRDCRPRFGSLCVTWRWARLSVALQDADCTTVRREVDLGQALADGSEEALGELAGAVEDVVRIGLEIGRCLIVDGADGGLRVEVERIVAGKANFDEAFAAVHRIKTSADEVAVKKNVAGGGHQADIRKAGLHNLGVAADGTEVELAGTLRADERTSSRAHDDVAGNFLEVHVARDAFEFHVAHNLLDIDQAGLRF